MKKKESIKEFNTIVLFVLADLTLDMYIILITKLINVNFIYRDKSI